MQYQKEILIQVVFPKVHFKQIMNAVEIRHQISVLKEIAKEYSGKTIDNIIVQLQSRDKEVTRMVIKEVIGVDINEGA